MEGKPLTMNQLQAALEAAGKPWEAVETTLFLLPEDEKKLWLGYVPGSGEPTLAAREALAAANFAAYAAEKSTLAATGGYGAPASFDWRNIGGKNFVAPVKNQGGCGSCVAFGTTATVEGTLRVAIGDGSYPINLSEAHLFYCPRAPRGATAATAGGCHPHWMPAKAQVSPMRHVIRTLPATRTARISAATGPTVFCASRAGMRSPPLPR